MLMNTTMAAALMTLTLALAGCATRAQDDPRTRPNWYASLLSQRPPGEASHLRAPSRPEYKVTSGFVYPAK
jgi:hypothetical protein